MDSSSRTSRAPSLMLFESRAWLDCAAFEKKVLIQSWLAITVDMRLNTDTIDQYLQGGLIPMVDHQNRQDFEQRISKQLQGLSDVAETLTLRLLQLEEKFITLEDGMVLVEPSDLESTNLLLTDSHQRLQQLQALLDSSTDQSKMDDDSSKSLRLINQVVASEELPSLESPQSEETLIAAEKIQPQDTDEHLEELEDQDIRGELDETEYVDDPQMDLLSA